MIRSLKNHWSALKRSKPGRRFQDRYDRRKKEGSKSPWRRVANLALALLSLAIGIVLVVIPGPAILFFFISGSLLATESRTIAAGLDRLELIVRAAWLQTRRFWRRLSKGGKATVIAFAVLLMGAALHVSYRFIMAR